MLKQKRAELTKTLAKELIKQRGEARGIHLRNDAEYILRKKGKASLAEVEKELESLGVPIKYDEIKNLDFYPAGWRPISLLAIQQVFNWDNSEIRNMCEFGASASLAVRLYLKFFHSVQGLLKVASKLWREYWSEGELLIENFDEKNKEAIIIIKDFKSHPIFCVCLEGYINGLAKMVTGSDNIKCEEINCIFKGDKVHRYKINW